MGYRGKLSEREQARRLRAAGWTMPDIAAELHVSRSSVSLWTRDVPVELGPRRLRHPRPPNALARRKASEIAAMLEAGEHRIGSITDRDLLIAGTALYAGEGSKTGHAIGFANTDARMIALFCAWLRRFFVLDERRLRVRLYLHEGLDLQGAMQHWSAVTGIPVQQFGKPYRAVADPSRRFIKHAYGCASVTYSCSSTHRAAMGLVEALLRSTSIPG